MRQTWPSKPRIVLAGSVGSSRRVLQALLKHQMNVVGVLGLSPTHAHNVSGFTRMDDLAALTHVPYVEFDSINTPDIVACVQEWQPDLFFVVGLSQLVKAELLSIPKLGCIGFHPTQLPYGRGRAPLAWLVLDNSPGAATFFLMDAGMDSGPIAVQEPFVVSPDDYASDVVQKLEEAIDNALDRWLPKVRNGDWELTPQIHDLATYNGRRSPEDGLIVWEKSAQEIYTLIRATARPHPGAYTYVGSQKIIVWQAKLDNETPYRGVNGRVLVVDDQQGYLVQTGNGLLWLTEIEFVANSGPSKLRVGQKLGYSPQDEIYELRHRMARLEEKLTSISIQLKELDEGR